MSYSEKNYLAQSALLFFGFGIVHITVTQKSVFNVREVARAERKLIKTKYTWTIVNRTDNYKNLDLKL